MRIAMPSPTVFESTRRRGFWSVVGPKSRLPLPSTTGKTISRSSSTRSLAISVCTSLALPWTTMSPFSVCFSFETDFTTSPLSTVELFQSGFSSVEDTTYLGMLLNLCANSPSCDGHALANSWYVTRPSSSAAESRVSSILNLPPSSPCSILNVHPPYLKPSAPPGSSITPSSEMNSVTTIRPMVVLLSPLSAHRFGNHLADLSRGVEVRGEPVLGQSECDSVGGVSIPKAAAGAADAEYRGRVHLARAPDRVAQRPGRGHSEDLVGAAHRHRGDFA